MKADINDMASEEEELRREEARKQQVANRELTPIGWDHKTCIEDDCGIDIEPVRLQHGFFRCFDCQSAREVKIKRYGRV